MLTKLSILSRFMIGQRRTKSKETWFEPRGTIALPATAVSNKRQCDGRQVASADTLHNADLKKITKSNQNETQQN